MSNKTIAKRDRYSVDNAFKNCRSFDMSNRDYICVSKACKECVSGIGIRMGMSTLLLITVPFIIKI